MATKAAARVRRMVRRRRSAWIAEHGPCAKCGSGRRLEIDHIDPSTKTADADGTALWTMRAELRAAELAKCQVLCHDCHREKSAREQPGQHGTRSRYKAGCRCTPCRTTAVAYNRTRRHARRLLQPGQEIQR